MHAARHAIPHHRDVHHMPVTPPPFPTYTDYPVVDWLTIDPQYYTRGTPPDMGAILHTLSTPCYITLPDGFFGEIIDFSYSNYGIYTPNCLGLWGLGPDRATIQMRKNSSTKVGLVPAQSTGDSNPLWLMRLGPLNGVANSSGTHLYGFSLIGTDQPVDTSTGLPHSYGGVTDFESIGSTFQWLRVKGVPGNANSPPGETFEISSYRCSNCLYEYIETDGINPDGELVGAGAFGIFASQNCTVRYCYFHDSRDSGWTYATAGAPDTGTPSQNITSKYVQSWQTPSIFRNNGQPQANGYGGFNDEGLIGTILFDHPDFIQQDPINKPNEHMSFSGLRGDAQITINEPNWHPELGYYPASNGAFWVHMPVSYDGQTNQQVTLPTVIKNGVTLQPAYRYQNGSFPVVNPATQYILWV